MQNLLGPQQGTNSQKRSGEKKGPADVPNSNKTEEAGISITQSKVVVNDEEGS